MGKTKSTCCFCFISPCCDDDTASEHSIEKPRPVPEIIISKDPGLISNSVPINYSPINVNAPEMSYSPDTLSPYTNDTSLSESSITGKKELSPEDLEAFKQGVKNTEVINSGGVIEANHKYISKVVMPNGNGLYSHPVSRASSVKMAPGNMRLSNEILHGGSTMSLSRPVVRRNTERIRTGNTFDEEQTYFSLRNTENISTGRTIEAEHTYMTTVAVPTVGYPRPRSNSLKRPIHLILYPDGSVMRRESWYRSGEYMNRGRIPLSHTRSADFQL